MEDLGLAIQRAMISLELGYFGLDGLRYAFRQYKHPQIDGLAGLV